MIHGKRIIIFLVSCFSFFILHAEKKALITGEFVDKSFLSQMNPHLAPHGITFSLFEENPLLLRIMILPYSILFFLICLAPYGPL